MSILLLSIEDRETMPAWFKCNLQAAGISVEATIGGALFATIEKWRPDIVLLAPKIWTDDHAMIVRALRANATTRDIIIMEVTADGKTQIPPNLSVDATIIMPKMPLDLAAQIQTVLGEQMPNLVAQEVSACELTFSTQVAGFFGPYGALPLSRTECRLLEFMLRRAGRIFSRNQLLTANLEFTLTPNERTLDVHIARIRRVLRKAGLAHVIRTVRGVGYGILPDIAKPEERRHEEPVTYPDVSNLKFAMHQ